MDYEIGGAARPPDGQRAVSLPSPLRPSGPKQAFPSFVYTHVHHKSYKKVYESFWGKVSLETWDGRRCMPVPGDVNLGFAQGHSDWIGTGRVGSGTPKGTPVRSAITTFQGARREGRFDKTSLPSRRQGRPRYRKAPPFRRGPRRKPHRPKGVRISSVSKPGRRDTFQRYSFAGIAILPEIF